MGALLVTRSYLHYYRSHFSAPRKVSWSAPPCERLVADARTAGGDAALDRSSRCAVSVPPTNADRRRRHQPGRSRRRGRNRRGRLSRRRDCGLAHYLVVVAPPAIAPSSSTARQPCRCRWRCHRPRHSRTHRRGLRWRSRLSIEALRPLRHCSTRELTRGKWPRAPHIEHHRFASRRRRQRQQAQLSRRARRVDCEGGPPRLGHGATWPCPADPAHSRVTRRVATTAEPQRPASLVPERIHGRAEAPLAKRQRRRAPQPQMTVDAAARNGDSRYGRRVERREGDQRCERTATKVMNDLT